MAQGGHRKDAASDEAGKVKLCIHISRDKKGCYIASCPALPGCQSHGDTPKQATERLTENIRGYIAALCDFVPEHLDCEITEVRNSG